MSIDMFLKVDGLDGESADQKHAKWIGVLSFAHQVSQAAAKETGTGGRTRRGAADFQNLEVVKYLDAATPDLNMWCAAGEHIKKVKLELCESNGERRPYMRYVLENASIMSVAPSALRATAPDPRDRHVLLREDHLGVHALRRHRPGRQPDRPLVGSDHRQARLVLPESCPCPTRSPRSTSTSSRPSGVRSSDCPRRSRPS
jgi:type VI secretion system secreted protein Hcp